MYHLNIQKIPNYHLIAQIIELIELQINRIIIVLELITRSTVSAFREYCLSSTYQHSIIQCSVTHYKILLTHYKILILFFLKN